MFESIREVVKSGEKEIIDAAPSNFTAFVNVSAISLPEPIETPLIPSTRSPTIPIFNTPPEVSYKYGRHIFFSMHLGNSYNNKIPFSAPGQILYSSNIYLSHQK